MVKTSVLQDLDSFDIVGFATFTDYLGPPQLVYDFMQKMPQQKNKPAFVFVTYGFIPGNTLKALADLVEAKGFKVVAGHYLKMPESYPPAIVGGITDENAPDDKELKKFNNFIKDLDEIINTDVKNKEIKKAILKIGFINRLLPILSRTRSRKKMGEKFVDQGLCIKCGLCAKECPYDAIILAPFPAFDMTKCYGCWRCYNRCPKKAIYTKKFRNIGNYPKPNENLEKKLMI